MTHDLSQQFVGLVWVFGWVAFFLILRWMSIRRQQWKLELIHRERLAAMEKGIPMPELPDYDGPARPGFFARITVNPRWPLGLGALFLTTGPGVSLALWLSGDPYHNQVWPMGLIGIFVGVGLFLYYGLTRPRDAR
jgi:hypothetical protein